MIILEGCDNTGKTTLGEALSRLLCVEVVHSVRPDKGLTPEQVFEYAVNQLKDRPVILDRVYALSEPVYGNVCRGKPASGPYTTQMMAHLAQSDHLLIYCRPPSNVVMTENGREQMDGVKENFLKLLSFYDNVIGTWQQHASLEIIVYDWTNPEALDSVLKQAHKYWEQRYGL